jgi:hypothetical protein
LAVAGARSGDLDALSEFVTDGFKEDQAASVNLAYWAYWIGQPTLAHYTEVFVAPTLDDVSAVALFWHLAADANAENPTVELYLFTMLTLFNHAAVQRSRETNHHGRSRAVADLTELGDAGAAPRAVRLMARRLAKRLGVW